MYGLISTANVVQELAKYRTELQSARSSIKTLNSTNDGLNSQLAIADDKINSLNKVNNDQNNKLRDS